MSNRNVVIVAHKLHTTPDDDLIAYLNGTSATNVLHICHSFSDTPDRRSYCRWYCAGKLLKQDRSPDYRRLPEPLIYVKELFFTIRWVSDSTVAWDRYIGMDGLCTLFGLMLRAAGRLRSVTFWNIDFVPRGRFAQPWKNAVYRLVNRFSALRVDEMWDHTDLMVKEKQRIVGLGPDQYRSHRVVPLCVWTDRIRRFNYDDCDRHTLAFMGHLIEKQGVQLVLRAVPRIVEQVPDFRLKVIGNGAYEAHLRMLAKQLGVERSIEFVGRIEDDEEMERELACCGAGIAPYMRSLDTFTQFGADPGKIKTYLACGLPILLTDVPWIAPEVESQGCGQIILEDPDDITAKVTHLLTDRRANQACRENSARYAREFNCHRLFGQLGL